MDEKFSSFEQAVVHEALWDWAKKRRMIYGQMKPLYAKLQKCGI
jgi:hypothetical protein